MTNILDYGKLGDLKKEKRKKKRSVCLIFCKRLRFLGEFIDIQREKEKKLS